MILSEEDVADLIADLERVRRETEALQADLKRAQRERDAAVAEKELHKREYEAELEWLQYDTELEGLQSDRMGMPMFSLSEGPQQSAPTAMALAAEARAAETMTGTRVFPDTVTPDASVERAAIKLTSAAGPSSKICGERRASTGILFPLEVHYHNSSWLKHGSSSTRNN